MTATSPPIEIFRAGRHTASDGRTITFSAAELQAAVSAYDPALHEAPLTVGHPVSDTAPAYGWVSKMDFSAPVVTVQPNQVNPDFAELVNAGAFKKISASWYLPDSPSNPTPGNYYLRHVAFLGAVPPALHGLKNASFAAADQGHIEFGDWSDVQEANLFGRLRDWLIGKFGLDEADKAMPSHLVDSVKEAALRPVMPAVIDAVPYPTSYSEGNLLNITDVAAREAALVTREAELVSRTQAIEVVERGARLQAHTDFAQRMVNEGRLLPRDQARAVSFMQALPASASVVEFSEAGVESATPVVEVFKAFVAGLPHAIDFGERAGGDRIVPVNAASAADIGAAAATFREQQSKLGRTVSIELAVQHVMDHQTEGA